MVFEGSYGGAQNADNIEKTEMADHREQIAPQTDTKSPIVDTHSASPTEGSPDHTSTPTATSPPAPPTIAKRFAYFRTRSFYIVLILGQFLSLCLTGTSTMSTLLVNANASIPAFQSLLLYCLLTLTYTPIALYHHRHHPRGYWDMVRTRGWRYLLFAFCDVQGNYFIVLAFRYTTILSVQLINFWAIVVVVLVSRFALRVRYRWFQIAGILVCVGGVGVLIGSDHIQGNTTTGVSSGNQLKGDLFALLAASFYGLSNIAEEYLVCDQPVWEVLSQLGQCGLVIIGIQSAIFDRQAYRDAQWSLQVAGYLVGYTLILWSFYVGAPLIYRMSSAAFFNISLLTSSFWGTVVGVRAFGYMVHWMYPIAMVLIVVGQCVYYFGQGEWGESKKVWLGEDQSKGVDGFGTARRKIAKKKRREVVM